MVKVGFLEDEPAVLAAVAAKISRTPFEKGSIKKLYRKCRGIKFFDFFFKRRVKAAKKLVNSIMKKHGHMILADFLPYAITLEDISLWSNLFLAKC